MGLPTGTVVIGTNTYTFGIWRGQIRPQQPILDAFQRLGQAGESVQVLGSTAPPSRIHAIGLATTLSSALSFRASVLGMVGAFANITEPNGASWTNALIVAADAMVIGGVRNLNGTSYPYSVDCALVIKAQQ